MADGLKIGEVAARTGLNPHTLRYYELAGLLSDITRRSNGRRMYSEKDVERALLLSKLRASGMSVAEVRRFVELAEAPDEERSERRELLIRQRKRIIDQIAELQEGLRVIDDQLADSPVATDH